MTGSKRQIQSKMFRITVPSSVRYGGFTEVLRQVVRRGASTNTWREDNRFRRDLLKSWSGPDVIRSDVIMPAISAPSMRLSRDASLGRNSSSSGELVLKNLAEQLLSEDELWIFKQTLQHFRVTRSVPSLCTSLRPLITSTERLMLLVELAQHLPTEPLRRDFQKLCTLSFPKYHTFLRYFTPHQVTDGSKVIARDASGQYLVANKTFEKNSYPAMTNGTLTSEPRQDTTSVQGGESGFYSEQDDVSRHGNGRGSVSSRTVTTPSGSAPSTLQRPPRPSSQQPSQSQRTSTTNRQSIGIMNSGPLKILSGSFQSLALKNHRGSFVDPLQGGPGIALHQKRILLARRSDGSLGVGIKGGKEYGTPILVYVIEAGCQAEQEGLNVGDRIIDVNGTDFTNLTHAEAVTLMRNAWNIIMTVESDSASESNGRKSSAALSDDGVAFTELEILVYPSTAGRLGCAVNRDTETGDIIVKSVEKNSAAGKAGLLKGDTILQIDGMVVNTLTERQIATLTNSKRVRLRLKRKIHIERTYTEDSTVLSKSRKDTVMSDDVFSPLDFSSPNPVMDDDMFTFAASTPRNAGRSRSEERILADPQPNGHVIYGQEPGVWRAETSPDIFNQVEGQTAEGSVQRIYRPRTIAVPSSSQQHRHHHQDRNGHSQAPVRNGGGGSGGSGGGGGGGGVYNTMTRGRSQVRQPPPQSPRYTIVYSVRGRSTDTIVHPEVSRRPPSGSAHQSTHSRSTKMRYIRNRSRSREPGSAHNSSGTLSSADRDLLQAVQSGVEKRQRALRLSLYQVPANDDEDWRI
ncbi:uncharacterized protein [Littorina saxatilis]|uniref:uncharacterized protein n=1 Tax=Littorina saxatilis TaxID=31220 RepID=UPI0038B43D34